MKTLDTDYLVVGAGLAGLMAAIRLAPHGRVTVVTKKNRGECNTNYAQGGVACVVAEGDSFEAHVADTLDAGAGLCDEEIVRRIVSSGPEGIDALEAIGLKFTERTVEEGGGYDLGKEGGHSRRRVLHCGDITGERIEQVLLDHVQTLDSVTLADHHMVIDLVTTGWLATRQAPRAAASDVKIDPGRCVGAYILNETTGEITASRAGSVILATGGGGKVYLYTHNADVATGDGVAIAWRAGVPIKNMEFIQFHPTCLYHPDAKSFLISEAVRGEGALLVNAAGNSFVEDYDRRGALAPRDIVARAIDREMKKTGAECVYLDIRHKSEAFIRERFPNIYKACLGFGIDMAKDLVPVVPAAHYCCGGVEAAMDGETALPGLFACGEVTCTGLHGANRLASNSLLEAMVCANALVEKIVSLGPPPDSATVHIPDWEYGDAVPSDEAVVVEHNWNEVRTCMWDYVGIVRTDKRLERALRRITMLRQEIRAYYLDYLVTPDTLELRNITAVAELIIRSAMKRKESRGLHYTLDYPDRLPDAIDTVIADVAGSHR